MRPSLRSLPDTMWGTVLLLLSPRDQLWATSTCKDLFRCIYQVRLTARVPRWRAELALASLVRATASLRLQGLETIVLSRQDVGSKFD